MPVMKRLILICIAVLSTVSSFASLCFFLFYPATGLVRSFGNVVTCPRVDHPVAVRYCFRNWSKATLFNSYGIPVGPFRSDDWDDIVK